MKPFSIEPRWAVINPDGDTIMHLKDEIVALNLCHNLNNRHNKDAKLLPVLEHVTEPHPPLSEEERLANRRKADAIRKRKSRIKKREERIASGWAPRTPKHDQEQRDAWRERAKKYRDRKKHLYTNHIQGWTTHRELQWLYDQASKMETIAEIGSWMGRSTHALLSGTKGVVYAIDHFKGSGEAQHEGIDPFPSFVRNVGHFENLTLLKMASVEAGHILNSVDMVFIDGSHTYEDVLTDIDTWMPKTKKLICGHDYNWPEVKSAVDQRFPDVKTGPGCIWYVELGE